MMTLIALAITVAFVFSAAVTLGYPGMPLWEELARWRRSCSGPLDRDAVHLPGAGALQEPSCSPTLPFAFPRA
jgi:hypothetical protein